MIFQDPFASLNPVKRIDHHIARPLRIHRICGRRAVDGRVRELLARVGLVPPDEIAQKYPHQLSGGQRQRVAIARALAVEPSVILADEPISMLDVSIRIGILNLILQLKRELGIAFLYITHDIASARYVADEVLVMYRGRIVEQGPTDAVLRRPAARLHQAAAVGRAEPGERPAAGAARARRARRRERLRARRGAPRALRQAPGMTPHRAHAVLGAQGRGGRLRGDAARGRGARLRGRRAVTTCTATSRRRWRAGWRSSSSSPAAATPVWMRSRRSCRSSPPRRQALGWRRLVDQLGRSRAAQHRDARAHRHGGHGRRRGGPRARVPQPRRRGRAGLSRALARERSSWSWTPAGPGTRGADPVSLLGRGPLCTSRISACAASARTARWATARWATSASSPRRRGPAWSG